MRIFTASLIHVDDQWMIHRRSYRSGRKDPGPRVPAADPLPVGW